MKWRSVTATDAQAVSVALPGRHPALQPPARCRCWPALALPRANLFIADDVGLGKTIEAGLVMQELLLRQRVQKLSHRLPGRRCACSGATRCGAALRASLRDLQPRVRGAPARGARLRGQPLDAPSRASSSRTRLLRRPEYWRAAAASSSESARRAACSSSTRRTPRRRPAAQRVRHRHARSRRAVRALAPPLRAPALPVGHAAQRALEQLLGAARDPRSAALHARRGRRSGRPRAGDGAPAQEGHP